MGGFIFAAGRACALGLVGWSFPRLLLAFGVPLDRWIVAIAEWLTGVRDVISPTAALWSLTLFLAIVLWAAEWWWRPLARLAAQTTTQLPSREFLGDKPGSGNLTVQFDPSIPGCVSPDINTKQFRMKVANYTGKTCDECRGFIIQIDGPNGYKFVERIPLTWALLVHIVEHKLHDGDAMFLNLVERRVLIKS